MSFGETLSYLIELFSMFWRSEQILIEPFSGYVLDKANFYGRGYSHGGDV